MDTMRGTLSIRQVVFLPDHRVKYVALQTHRNVTKEECTYLMSEFFEDNKDIKRSACFSEWVYKQELL